jgi:hypothetical protein
VEILIGIIVGILWHITSCCDNDEIDDWDEIRRNPLKDIDREE